MPQAIFAYHLGMDAEQYAFFRIPKLLITEPYFRRLSTDAKLLYGLMLDRMSLSMRNGWMDDDGHVYIYFTLENACKRALEYTPRPSLKNIQAILASGQDKAIPEQSAATASSSRYGFTRGAAYYGRGNK